jgi:hypothetical protein
VGRLGLRLLGVAAISLAVVGALGFGLVRLLPPPRREAKPVVQDLAAISPPKADDVLAPVAPVAVKPLDAPPSRPQAMQISPEAPGPDSPPEIVGTDPAVPEAGGSLAIQLGGAKPGTAYQFRTGPEEKWQPAPEGRVVLKGIKPGPLALEFRIVDSSGRASPVGKRLWTVLPLPQRPQPVAREWREGDEFFQEVQISRVSRYQVMGVDLGQNVQYAFVSRLRIAKKADDGTMQVRQKIEAVRLGEADRALQAQLDEMLGKIKGSTFVLTLNPQREVVEFDGDPGTWKVFTGANPLGGTSFMLWSFLDKAGWKELAELSFFRPREPVRKSDRWARPISHSWGPLGQWQGQVGYVHLGRQAGKERYEYALDMVYRPPPAGAGAALPFQISRSDFRVQTAAGSILFDAERGRVSAAEERFHVRGQLAVTALGVDAVVDMDEAQLFRLRLHDRNPWEK